MLAGVETLQRELPGKAVDDLRFTGKPQSIQQFAQWLMLPLLFDQGDTQLIRGDRAGFYKAVTEGFVWHHSLRPGKLIWKCRACFGGRKSAALGR